MKLRDYINAMPRSDRGTFRRALAVAHGKSEELVKKWANHPPPVGWSADKIKQMSRPHPADLGSIRITEALTDHKVTRHDLRPEVFGRSTENMSEN